MDKTVSLSKLEVKKINMSYNQHVFCGIFIAIKETLDKFLQKGSATECHVKCEGVDKTACEWRVYNKEGRKQPVYSPACTCTTAEPEQRNTEMISKPLRLRLWKPGRESRAARQPSWGGPRSALPPASEFVGKMVDPLWRHPWTILVQENEKKAHKRHGESWCTCMYECFCLTLGLTPLRLLVECNFAPPLKPCWLIYYCLFVLALQMHKPCFLMMHKLPFYHHSSLSISLLSWQQDSLV